jgi:membrane associated rhomboid family serine protease
MTIGERFGLQRFPIVTATVFGVTAFSNILQFCVPGMLERLQRTPAGLHGDWWRTLTSLFVQDGGVAGTLSNLAFLVASGTVAEQVISRPRWLVCYFGAGLAAEFAGYAWQPYGGGNSVAICGLAGAIAMALWLGDERLTGFAPMLLMFWCGALLSSLWYPLLAIGIAVGVLTRIGVERGVAVARPAAVAALVTAVVVAVAQDFHGAALMAGIAIAGVLALVARRRVAVA